MKPVLRVQSQSVKLRFHPNWLSGPLRCLSPRRPPLLHHRRQFLPHGRTHGFPSRRFLGDRRSLLGPRFALLLCPPSLLCGGDSGTCCRAHFATFRATRRFHLARLRWTASPCGVGTQTRESRDCTFDTASFLPKLCHYALNVNLVPFSIAISGPAVQAVNPITPIRGRQALGRCQAAQQRRRLRTRYPGAHIQRLKE